METAVLVYNLGQRLHRFQERNRCVLTSPLPERLQMVVIHCGGGALGNSCSQYLYLTSLYFPKIVF